MKHRLIAADSRKLKTIEDESVQLVVTSPPYPMIEMWDQSFGEMDPSIRADLEDGEKRICVYQYRRCDADAERAVSAILQSHCGCKLFFVDGLQRIARHPLEKAIQCAQ